MARKFGLTSAELGQLREVIVPARLRNQFLAAAAHSARESCAALYGVVEGSTLAIARWRPLTNLADSGDHFVVAVGDLLRRPARSAEPARFAAGPARRPGPGPGERLVGLLHTHPHAPSHPSDADRLGIARLPLVWIIAGAGPGGTTGLRSFGWSDSGVRELPTHVTAAAPHADRSARP